MRMVASGLSAFVVVLAVGSLLGALPQRAPWRVRAPRPPNGRRWLLQAGLDLTPLQFWLGSAAGGVVAFGLLLVLTGVWSVALAPAILVSLLPRAYFARVRERRLSEIQLAWPDGLRDLVASITSGLSLHRAMEELAESGPAALREPFARFSFLAAAVGVAPALEVIQQELADPTTDRVLEVLALAQRRGGPQVAEILRDLADATTRDLWTLEEIRTLSLEQRINARAVFVLPWLVLIAITMQDGPFREFYASPAGLIVVTAGAVLSAAGMFLVGRLGREPEEPRVVGGPDGWEEG